MAHFSQPVVGGGLKEIGKRGDFGGEKIFVYF